MKIYIYLTTLITVCLLASCKTIRTRNCVGSIYGTTTMVEVEPCPQEPCVFNRGKSSTIKVHFTPTEKSTTLDFVLTGEIGPAWVRFPFSNANVCTTGASSECHCPLDEGGNYVATKILPFSTAYPPIDVEIKVQLRNQENHDVSCVKFPVIFK